MFHQVNPALHPAGFGVDMVEQADKRVIKPIKHKSAQAQMEDETKYLANKRKSEYSKSRYWS